MRHYRIITKYYSHDFVALVSMMRRHEVLRRVEGSREKEVGGCVAAADRGLSLAVTKHMRVCLPTRANYAFFLLKK